MMRTDDADDAGPLEVSLRGDRIHIGEHFSVAMQRTLRLPDDGREYPLPPGLGTFPVRSVTEFGDKVPARWRARGGFVVPMYQREALWLNFTAAPWNPVAVRIGVGVDAISGGPWVDELSASPQNYVVCPDQPWLDGANTGAGSVRQFVAVDLGSGDTIEEQLTGAVHLGGIQIRVYEAKPGQFQDRPPVGQSYGMDSIMDLDIGDAVAESVAGMGVGMGGVMGQRIYPDPYGLPTWNTEAFGTAYIHLVNSVQFKAISGTEPPATPVSPVTYSEHGLPWFDLYDEGRGDQAPSARLASVQSVRERYSERGATTETEQQPVIDPETVITLPNRPLRSEGKESHDG